MNVRGIGRASAVSWPSFWVCLAVAVLVNLSDPYTSHAPGDLGLDLLAVSLSVIAMFAVMLLLRPMLLGDVAVTPRPGRAMIMFAAGAITRGLAVGLLLGAFGTGDPRLGVRAIQSLVVFAPLAAVTAGVLDLLRGSAERRGQLEARSTALRAAEHDDVVRIAAMHEGAMERVRQLLLADLAALHDGRLDSAAASLRRDAEEAIRPLSHEMAARDWRLAGPQPSSGSGRVGWRDVWQAASLGRPFRPLLTAAFLVVGFLVTLITYVGDAVHGVAYALAFGVMIAVSLGVAERWVTPRLRRLAPAPRTAVFAVAAVLCTWVPAVLLTVIINATGGSNGWRVGYVVLFIGPLTVWLLALEQALRQQLAATEAELASTAALLERAVAATSAEARHEERRLSRALHGPVQAAVLAAAMHLDEGDTASAERLIAGALHQLERGGRDERGVASALDEIGAFWAGLCRVDVVLPRTAQQALDATPAVAGSVIEVCTEACSNAVRHGAAEHVTISVTTEGPVLDLLITDDGAPGAAPDGPGLGSALLDDVSVSWGRGREDGRTVLRARLPLVVAAAD